MNFISIEMKFDTRFSNRNTIVQGDLICRSFIFLFSSIVQYFKFKEKIFNI